MTVNVIDGYVVSDEGTVIAQGFIAGNVSNVGYHLKQTLIKICRDRNIRNYKILPFHHNSEFGLAAVMPFVGNPALN